MKPAVTNSFIVSLIVCNKVSKQNNNNNPDNKTTKTVVEMGQSNRWEAQSNTQKKVVDRKK